jgi:ribosomal protein L40E
MNGDRHNGFGSRMSGTARGATRALELTRRQLDAQPAGAAFTAAPATNQQACGGCNATNPAGRSKCRYCGEELR